MVFEDADGLTFIMYISRVHTFLDVNEHFLPFDYLALHLDVRSSRLNLRATNWKCLKDQ